MHSLHGMPLFLDMTTLYPFVVLHTHTVHTQNYRERNAFIVTQAPMADTVADFWRMMWETKSAAVVMLTELTEGDQVREGVWFSHVMTTAACL